MTINFYIREEKGRNAKIYPIMCRISKEGGEHPLKRSTYYRAEKNQWNERLQLVNSKHPNQKIINNYLHNKRQAALDFHAKNIAEHGHPFYPIQELVEQLFPPKQKVSAKVRRSLLGRYEDWLEEKKREINHEPSYKRFKNIFNDLRAFKAKGNKVEFSVINRAWMVDFIIFLESGGYSGKPNGDKTVSAKIGRLKSFFDDMASKGVQIDDSYRKVKISMKKSLKFCPTKSEVEKIWNINLAEFCKEFTRYKKPPHWSDHGGAYEIVRDYFIFSCETGIRWSDFSDITTHSVKYVPELGVHLFSVSAIEKTGGYQALPLTDRGLEIYEKYGREMGKHLPSNQKCNEYIKLFAQFAKIEGTFSEVRYFERGKSEVITKERWKCFIFHSARAYWTTEMLKIMDLAKVQKLRNDKSPQTTMEYFRPEQSEIIKEIISKRSQ